MCSLQLSQEIMTKDRNCLDAYALRATALFNLHSEDLAIKCLQAALRFDPDHIGVQTQYRQFRKLMSETKRLKEEITKAMSAKQFQQAATLCDEAMKLDPEDRLTSAKYSVRKATALVKLAEQLDAEGKGRNYQDEGAQGDGEMPAEKKWKDALRAASAAIYFDETMIQGYLYKTKALQGLWKFEQAIEELEDLFKGAAGGGHFKRDESVHEHLQHAKKAKKMATRKDYYRMLGITKGATQAQVKTGYKKTAMKWHPDRHSTKTKEEQNMAEVKFKDANDANEILSDAQSRQLYDRGMDIEEIAQVRPEFHNVLRPLMLFLDFSAQGAISTPFTGRIWWRRRIWWARARWFRRFLMSAVAIGC
jgi:hypothetical protein